MEVRVRVGTLERSIVCSYINVQVLQLSSSRIIARAVRAENKRHWKSQIYIKHYPNLRIKEYYGIFRSGLFQVNTNYNIT